MVHFPEFAHTRLWIHRAVRGFYPRGFPHSEIPGSKPACGSPRLIAACHVLHRLLLPRHPPCALSSLTIKFTRGTAASLLAFSYQPSAISETTTRLRKFYGPNYLLIARQARLKCFRTPAGFSLGTHKNLQPCRLPNLFSCQISSSPACAGSPCLSRYGSYSTPKYANFKSLSNPMFGAKRLS
jgi:hypothetical protein